LETLNRRCRRRRVIIITIIHDVITTDGLIETRPTLFKESDDDDAQLSIC
jgi:hypothetical protein